MYIQEPTVFFTCPDHKSKWMLATANEQLLKWNEFDCDQRSN